MVLTLDLVGLSLALVLALALTPVLILPLPPALTLALASSVPFSVSGSGFSPFSGSSLAGFVSGSVSVPTYVTVTVSGFDSCSGSNSGTLSDPRSEADSVATLSLALSLDQLGHSLWV